MAVTPEELRSAMGHVPTPVAVVTTIDDHGRPCGFTASSFTCVSLAPPLMLVCVAKSMRGHDTFTTAARFAVNVLGEHHQSLARLFATAGADKFRDGSFSCTSTDPPRLPDAVVLLDCRLQALHDAGDHSIVIGLVERTEPQPTPALLHVSRAFATTTAVALPKVSEPLPGSRVSSPAGSRRKTAVDLSRLPA